MPAIKVCDVNTEGLFCLMQMCSVTTLSCLEDMRRLEPDIWDKAPGKRWEGLTLQEYLLVVLIAGTSFFPHCSVS